MFYNAINGQIHIDDTTMDYIRFGNGSKILIMIPGLGDGLTTVKGKALPFAVMYKMYSKDYTVYMFSRKNQLPSVYSTRDMARDLKKAMDILSIENAHIVGVSQGGMVAQWLAIDYPEVINKLVLVVTSSHPTPEITSCVSSWMELARKDKYQELMKDNVVKMYSDAYVKKNTWLIPFTSLIKPKSYERFLIMADACLTHNCYEYLSKISAPTLIIGGAVDQVIGPNVSHEIHNSIKDSRLIIYDNYGHALYEEAKDFNENVMNFLK